MRKIKLTIEILKENSKENRIDINQINIRKLIDVYFYDKTLNKYTTTVFVKGICYKCKSYFESTFSRKYRESYKEKLDKNYINCCPKCRKELFYIQHFGKGITNPSQVKEIQKQKEQTTLEHYGVRHPLQNKELLEKSKDTCKKHYGVDYPMQSKVVNEKSKNTLIEKYGIDHNMKSRDVKEKTKQTWIKNYGSDHPMKDESIKKKAIKNQKKSLTKKYGTPNLWEIGLDKRKQTNLEKYGKEYPVQVDEFREKGLNTKLKNGTLGSVNLYRYEDELFDSSWELAFYIYHKLKNHNIIHETIKLEYKVNGKIHYYFPDFKVNKKLYEIKGDHLLKYSKDGEIIGLSTPYSNGDKLKNRKKFLCMKKNKVTIVDSHKIKKYLTFVEKQLGKDYLKRYFYKKIDMV